MYTKSSLFLQHTEHKPTGRSVHKFSLCRTQLLPKDASWTVCTAITENDRSQERSQKPWLQLTKIQFFDSILEINVKLPSMQKNGSKEARNHGETSTFKFIQGVRVAAAFFLASPLYSIMHSFIKENILIKNKSDFKGITN